MTAPTLRDLLLATPAWIGAVVAILGLTAWRRQLHGREGYELARRLLRATYRFRDAIEGARGPFSFSSVASADREQQSPRAAAADLWQKRWESINAARRELGAELLEAEILWGASHAKLYDGVYACESDLYGAVLEQLDSLEPNPDETVQTPDKQAARRSKLYARADKSDQASRALLDAVAGVELDLRPRLKRPS